MQTILNEQFKNKTLKKYSYHQRKTNNKMRLTEALLNKMGINLVSTQWVNKERERTRVLTNRNRNLNLNLNRNLSPSLSLNKRRKANLHRET